MNHNGGDYEIIYTVPIVRGERTVTAIIGLDIAAKHIYFASTDHKIKRINYDGSGEVKLIDTKTYPVEGMAIDWINK